jgi:hypothetical protein
LPCWEKLMDLMNEPDEEQSDEKEPDYTGLIVAAATLPLVWYFSHIGKADLGLNIGICLFANIIAIRFRWNLRRHVWFWATMVFVIAAELPLVLMIHWPKEWVPGVALLPIALVVYLVAMGAVQLGEKLFGKSITDEDE